MILFVVLSISNKRMISNITKKSVHLVIFLLFCSEILPKNMDQTNYREKDYTQNSPKNTPKNDYFR